MGYIVSIDESLREREASVCEVRKGFSLGTCSTHASLASRLWVACTLPLYSYLLRFHLIYIIKLPIYANNLCDFIFIICVFSL